MPQSATSDKLLMIDDDQTLSAMLVDFLAAEGLGLQTAASGEEGLRMLRKSAVDLIILDIMLPGMNGLEVLRQLRQLYDYPVLMLTARGDDNDRIIGLENGADDYLSKPFNPRELVARIRAILRRTRPDADTQDTITIGDLAIDNQRRFASVADSVLKLTGTEFEILHRLMKTPSVTVSKSDLCQQALGRELLPYDRSIDTHISNVRGKLESAGSRTVSIQTRRGIGYVLIENPAEV